MAPSSVVEQPRREVAYQGTTWREAMHRAKRSVLPSSDRLFAQCPTHEQQIRYQGDHHDDRCSAPATDANDHSREKDRVTVRFGPSPDEDHGSKYKNGNGQLRSNNGRSQRSRCTPKRKYLGSRGVPFRSGMAQYHAQAGCYNYGQQHPRDVIDGEMAHVVRYHTFDIHALLLWVQS